jgi:hypothetical protein
MLSSAPVPLADASVVREKRSLEPVPVAQLKAVVKVEWLRERLAEGAVKDDQEAPTEAEETQLRVPEPLLDRT